VPDVRTYASLTHARAAADFLLSHGILARVIPGRDLLTAQRSEHTVMIAEAAELERARLLLDELLAQPFQPDPEWESATAPDLSRLDPRTTAACPKCRGQLPLDASIVACPTCKAPVDVVDALLRQHGPEVLAACYPEVDADIPEEMVESAILSCPACGYSLSGLAERGLCPECGGDYSKRDILRGAGG